MYIILSNYQDNVKYDEANSELISEKANLAFPIEDGIPIMLIDKARNIK